MKKRKAKIGIVGCGNISDIYCTNCTKMDILEVVACADLIKEKAEEKAAKHNIPQVLSTKQLLADPEIDIVLNLTTPQGHVKIAMAAIKAGKSVYNEKPLTISRSDGKNILRAAARKKVLVGGAPDTFLGAGIQTSRKLIDDGVIGEVIGATAFFSCRGHESWHPDPEFYYKFGGGPMLDMGPYYLTALVNLLGPIRRVSGSARISFPERTITSKPKKGQKIKVHVPTHITGTLDFASGAIGTVLTSFDVWQASLPCIEIFGSKGTLSVPDPNGFDGPVRLWTPKKNEWQDIPLSHGYIANSRGIGLADMAAALLKKRPHRASGKLAYHVLDVMHAFGDASKAEKHIKITSSCAKPALLPKGAQGKPWGKLKL